MSKPNLSEIERRLSYEEDVSFTDSQYKKHTGLPLPKRKDYLEKRSAVAKLARRMGFSVQVQEKTIFFIKEK